MLMRKLNAGLWLSLFAIFLWFAAGTIARAQAENVAGLWHFDEGAGTTAYDSSGNGNTGTLASGAVFSAPSKFGEPGSPDAVSFNNSATGYIDVPDSPSLDITGPLTLEAWIYRTGPDCSGHYRTVVGKFARTTSAAPYLKAAYWLGLYTNCKLRGEISSNGTESVYAANGQTVVSANRWHHVAMVFKSGSITVYLDGVEDGHASGPLSAYNAIGTDVSIGAWNVQGYSDGVHGFFSGNIDEVRIWNRALSPDEIMASAQAGLRADWHFDEDSGTTVEDSSGYGNTGTLHDAGWGTGPNARFFNDLAFDGADDYVTVPNSSTLSISDNLTIDAWVKNDASAAGYYTVVSKGDGAADSITYGLQLILGGLESTTNGTLRFFIFSQTAGHYNVCDITKDYITDAHWHHVAVTTTTAGGGEVDLYVDGDNAGTCNGSPWDAPLPQSPEGLDIGQTHNHYTTTDRYRWDGQIDELHIWARALTQPEVAFLAGTSSPSGTQGELFVPEEMSQEFGSGAVFTSDWHVGTTPENTNAIVLGFIVPDDPGTTITDVAEKDKKASTPVDGAELVGSQNGTPSLWTLISAERENTDAHTLHLNTTLSDETKLGMNVQWSAP